MPRLLLVYSTNFKHALEKIPSNSMEIHGEPLSETRAGEIVQHHDESERSEPIVQNDQIRSKSRKFRNVHKINTRYSIKVIFSFYKFIFGIFYIFPNNFIFTHFFEN